MKKNITALIMSIASFVAIADSTIQPVQNIANVTCFQEGSEVGYEIRIYKNPEKFSFAQVVKAGRGFYGQQVATLFYSSTLPNGVMLFTTRQLYDPKQSNALTMGFVFNDNGNDAKMMEIVTKDNIPSEAKIYNCKF